MSDDKKKPTQLTGNMQIDIATLAAALRQATDPLETAKLQRLQEIAGKNQVKIPNCVSPTGSRFTLVIEEMRNKRTRQLEQCIKTLEDYEYPWSPELEVAAEAYQPPLRYWKNPDAAEPFAWGTEVRDEMGNMKRGDISQIIHPSNGQLNKTAKQHLYAETWRADLFTYVGLTVAQGNQAGLHTGKLAG